MSRKDWIRVKDLAVDVLLYSGARWPSKEAGKPVLQPISLTISIPTDIKYSAEHDDLNSSINYSLIASSLRSLLTPISGTPAFASLEDISRHIYYGLLLEDPYITLFDEVFVSIVQIKAPIHCSRIVFESSAQRQDQSTFKLGTFRHTLEDIDCHAIIGVNASERLEKQVARVHLSIEGHAALFEAGEALDTRAVIRRIYENVGTTEYLTLEALASYAAVESLKEIHRQFPAVFPAVSVKVSKPFALVFASASEVEISRTISDYPTQFTTNDKMQVGAVTGLSTAAIAFGSNLGDSFHNIELALRLLEVPNELLRDVAGKVDIVNTSFLYESTPMYVEDQPSFINGACVIETDLQPLQLLRLLKCIETTVGRVPSIRNGPRAVDLDVVFFNDEVIDTRALDARTDLENLEGQLVVPHPRMCEREFVLRPLNDMIPDFIHPVNRQAISRLLRDVAADPSLRKVMPVPKFPLSEVVPVVPSVQPVPSTLCHWVHPISRIDEKRNKFVTNTLLMAIVNTTPDSFSDGSDHESLPTAMAFAKSAVRDGADILDIGGYSTRPGAAFVSTQDEIDRVVPVVSCIRQDVSIVSVPISVDTFRPDVARAAILAGANIINDVYAFTGPTCYPYTSADAKESEAAREYVIGMKAVAREFAVPVVLMHSRGDAGSNKDYSEYSYVGADHSVVEGVRVELGRKVEEIVRGPGGVRRWMVMIDPGVGFSKTVEGNLEVLREAASVTADVLIGPDSARIRNPLAGYPCLIGSSRKSFLGAILAQDGRTTSPKERTFATAATVACAVQQGASVVRVHDVQEMADVLRVSKLIW